MALAAARISATVTRRPRILAMMAVVSALSSRKPPSIATLEMATERFAALAGGASPAGLVMVIAPEGPAGGANVLGVTREGATTCALAKLGVNKSAKISNTRLGQWAASIRSANPPAIGVTLAPKYSPQNARPV